MRIQPIVTVLIALCLTSIALAEQVGGPSGPDKGEFRAGAEGIVRTNVNLLISPWDWETSFKSRTFYGCVEYGISDCLSVRGKAGVAQWEEGIPPWPDRLKFDYGLAWAAGFRWRICHPEGDGTAFALTGQYAQTQPDDFVYDFGFGTDSFLNVRTKEWTGALTVGVPHGSARSYAGVVYSHLEADIDHVVEQIGFPPTYERLSGDKQQHVGVVVGMDHDLGGSSFWNPEVRGFDEEGISGSLIFAF